MKALVTGATSGIGRDMTRYLIQLGYKVYTYDRTSMTKGSEFVPFCIGMKKSSK